MNLMRSLRRENPKCICKQGKQDLNDQPQRICIFFKIRSVKPPGGGGTHMDTEEEAWWLKQEK